MAITKRGKYSYGENQSDLRQDMAVYSEMNKYPIDHYVDCKCECGHHLFDFYLDDVAGVAGRVCANCDKQHAMGDSTQFLDEADPEAIACFCDTEKFEITAGVHVYRDDKELNILSDHVRWLYIGLRCPTCGLLGVYGDWKNDYHPLDEFLAML